jgi:HPt (histidine-containing phosphotransfer) domain-containing protein
MHTKKLQQDAIEDDRAAHSFNDESGLRDSLRNGLRDSLFAGMGHEIHMSLNGVRGMLALLRDTELSPTQRNFADLAQTSADDLLRLFNDMLDSSKIAAGQHALHEPAPRETSDELEAMQEMFGSGFAELAALYLADMPKRIAALQEAAVAGDTLQLTSIAHALSGSCASIGATTLAKLYQDLELRCKAGLSSDCEPRLAAIRAEYARIETKLRTMVRSTAV